jgi:hypothetical protein
MANRSLTIRKPLALYSRLTDLENLTVREAQDTNARDRVQNTLRINGAEVSFTVTPMVAQPGRYYRLFRVNGKRTAKEEVPQKLLTGAS